MTKIHYQFYTSSTLTVVLKEVDFNNQDVSSITFQSLTQFLTTTSKITAFTKANYFLGDDYLNIRNDSSITTNSGNYVEEAYSFMGESLIYLRTRNLLASEVAKCFRTYIDDFFVDGLIVLDLYDSGSTSSPAYDIYSYSYGSLASTIKVVPSPVPPYLKFTPSTYTSSFISSSSFSWVYINTATTATTTTITVNQHNDAVTSTHLGTGALTISYIGLCVILATSQNCLIISKGTTYILYTLTQSSTGAITFTPKDITNTVSSAQTKVSWQVSNDCSRFSVDSYIYATFSGSFALANSNLNSFVWISIDKTFTYALVAGSIWKYDSPNNVYKSYYSTLNSTFTSGSVIQSYNKSIIVYKLTSSSALVNAFVDSGSSLALLPNMLVTGFIATPKIALSPQLSLVVIYGASTAKALNSIYYIDYTDKSVDKLDFPEDAVFDPSSVYISLEETWMYVRQLASSLQTPGDNE